MEHGGHVLHRAVSTSPTLYRREKTVESLHKSRRQTLSSMGQDALQVPFDHPGRLCRRLKHFSGLSPHSMHLGAPVSEQLPGLLGVLPLLAASKYQPHLLGHARHPPFQGYRIPLLAFLFLPDYSVLSPHPTRPLHLVPLPPETRTLGLPDLIACLYQLLGRVELVLHRRSIPEVVVHPLDERGANIDGHILNSLGMPVVTQQMLPRSCHPSRTRRRCFSWLSGTRTPSSICASSSRRIQPRQRC